MISQRVQNQYSRWFWGLQRLEKWATKSLGWKRTAKEILFASSKCKDGRFHEGQGGLQWTRGNSGWRWVTQGTIKLLC